MLTLCTSIAPRLSRLGEGDLEVGATYQLACVMSWLRFGAKVFTVNGEHEMALLEKAYPRVERCTVDMDAKNRPGGRPVPFIRDLLDCIVKNSGGGWCGLINSDIYLEGLEERWSDVENVLPGSLVVIRRMEMTWPSRTQSKVYPFGFDAFLMDPALCDSLPDCEFAMGIPWWDFWLPVVAWLRGFNVYQLKPTAAYHMSHPSVWNNEQFIGYGRVFLKQMRAEAERACEDSVLAQRGEWILNALELIKDAAQEVPPGMGTMSALSRYLEWFFEESGAVKSI